MIGRETFVLDASAGVKVVIPESGSTAAVVLFSRVIDEATLPLQVPDHFFAECANALRKGVHRKSLSEEQAARGIEELCGAELEVTPTRLLAAEALHLARTEGISTYDALYVALSDLTGVPLVTADRRLYDRLRGTRHKVVGLWEMPAA